MKYNSYTIGQISAICDVSIQALRYYDKINLIKPSEVDKTNNYRYYSDKDIQYLRIINDLKQIGFSLEEIKDYLKNDSRSLYINLLEQKRNEYRNKLVSVHTTLERINNRIDNLKLHDNAADTLVEFEKTIEIKNLPERMVLFKRYKSDCSHEMLVKRFFEVDNLAKKLNINALDSRLAVYHDYLNNFDPANCDLETCLPVKQDSKNKEYIRIIYGGLYATGIYKGAYKGQCRYLVDWINIKGYKITGPGVEVYINSFMNTRFPKNYLTEVQFPVEKVLTL